MSERQILNKSGEDIAIVGMSVNVPGAASVDAFWANLRAGVESIRRLDEETLLANGESAQKMRRKNYVPAAAMLDGFENFDAEFFGFSPKDAAILDPQHRKFLEVAWEAMEQAGHPPETIPGPIGVYAGCGMGSYFYFNICSNPDLVDDVGMFLLRHTGNDKDFLSTRVSHVFDLKGPSINLQTACSTSLVAIHYATQALQAGEVDMALAGGVTIELPQGRGYEFKENEILSPDGHCHAFDHRAEGTVFGSGAGCVALRRLSDAIADGDPIWAVIKGSAVNNDGAAKAGYLAPSVDGQSAAIRAALDIAGVAAGSIGMVECHGTGTYLGDPIEVAALTEAHRASTDATDYCRIGSVKTNIGHLDTAAGVAGLVKATLALHHREIPPSLGFEKPNPAIAFDGSPFRVADTLIPWDADSPRRAAVNALGVGGTNAHTILEEAPARAASDDSDWPFHPLVISARSKTALDAASANLANHLRAHPDQPLADVAWTLKEGRRAFDNRRVVVAESHAEAATLLEQGDTRQVFTHDALGDDPDVVFMFPGGGAQYPGMARDLYETEPVFAEWMDRGLDHLQPQLDYDIRALWLPESDTAAAAEMLKKPSAQLPLIAITEYALAQLWISWGVRPAQMVGHSMGENVAACLAGVMCFEDLIDLVLLRGRLFDTVPAGGMLSMSLPLDAVVPLLGDDLDIASVNAPNLTAVSGPQAALDALQEVLTARDVDHQRIAIDIAAHSRMLEPILEDYRAFLAGLDLRAPQQPFLSNRTGTFVTAKQATDPDYWVDQLRHTVHFADCIETLTADGDKVYLEVGPGKALSSLAQMCPGVKPAQVLASLRHPDQQIGDDAYFIGVFARLWACGVQADWSQVWGEARRNRVRLPTYPFQRASYFIAPGKATAEPALEMQRADDIADWGWVPRWKPAYADSDGDIAADPQRWLIFADEDGRADAVADRLRTAGHDVTCVVAGDAFAQLGDDRYAIAPEQGRDSYDALLAAMADAGGLPDRIAHFWLVPDGGSFRPGSSLFDRNLEQGFWSLMWLGQSLAEAAPDTLHLIIFTTGAAQVADETLAHPEKAMIAGPLGALAHEVPGITCATVDLAPAGPAPKRGWFAKPVDGAPAPDAGVLIEDMTATPANTIAAHRDGRRYEKSYRPLAMAPPEGPAFRAGGTYLITGGFGGIGQTVAADLLARYDAHVVLLNRGPLPDRAVWKDYLLSHAASNPTARRIRAAQRLEALGGRLSVATGDVTNPVEMAEVLRAYPNLTGVIHAAGALDDAPLLAKTDAEAQNVLAPKVQGMRVLDDLLADGQIETLVLFSSTSTATRGAGQADYVAANEYLNAYAASRRGDQTRVVAVNWGVWSDVGMAADAVGGDAADALPLHDMAAGILSRAGADAAGGPVFEAPLSDTHWILDQHRTANGQAVMPGTGMIEMLAEAAKAQGLGDRFAIEDLYFLRALDVADGTKRTARVMLRPDGTGFAAELRSDATVQGRAGWQLHAQARLVPLDATARTVNIDALTAACADPERAVPGGRLISPQETHLRFGLAWHVLRSAAWGAGEGIASLSLDENCVDGAQTILHPGLLDLATGWAIGHVPGYGGRALWVPVSYGRIRVFAPLPREIVSHVRLTGHGDGAARFDVSIYAPDGAVLVEVSDFSMTRLADGFAISAPQPGEVIFEDETDTRDLTPAEERLAYLVAQGITSAEGPEALGRAMAAGRSQVYVTALPLDGLIAQADRPVVEPKAGQSFARPDTGEDIVAPRNATELKMAEMWSNLLGVSPIGVEDSFFDLGGHSLIAVRLFAAVKREWGLDFPISVLFEAPTIAKCAALITAEVGEDAADADSDPTSDAAPKRFTHLVPLNQNTDKAAPPLFVVAGMFGNVLNLRHLAMQFGSERRVFGLQARGLIGDDAPHETVEDAARDYLAEMRQVQPHGPYLLSGFSGGGIMAYEMAQQLRAAGEDVALLALLDTPLPVRPGLTRPDKALIKLAELRRKGPRFLLDWARARWEWERHGKHQQGVVAKAPEAAFNNQKIEQAFLGAVARYQTPDWDGPLTLLRPKLDRHWKVTGDRWVSTEREYVFADNDWTRYAPALEIVEVPGDHDSMVLSPNVVVMAAHLRRIIGAALDADDPQHATAAE